MGLKEGFLSSALPVPRPGPRVTRKPCLAGLSSSVPGSPAAAKRWTDRTQVPRAHGEAGEATVLTDHFLEPPERTPGPTSSCRHYCSVRPAAAAGCGPPPCKVRCGHPPGAGRPQLCPGQGVLAPASPGPASCSPSGKGGACLGDQPSECSRPPTPGASTRARKGAVGSQEAGQPSLGLRGSCGILCGPRQPVRKGGNRPRTVGRQHRSGDWR